MDLSSFNTSKVTNMNSMFEGCTSLTNLDISNFDTSNVTGMNWMFYSCSKLNDLDIRQFDFSKVTIYINFFHRVPATSRIIVKDDTARNWIETNISSNYTNIVTVSEIQ